MWLTATTAPLECPRDASIIVSKQGTSSAYLPVDTRPAQADNRGYRSQRLLAYQAVTQRMATTVAKATLLVSRAIRLSQTHEALC